MSDVNNIPENVREKAVRTAKSCYEMGFLGRALDTLLTGHKITLSDGSWRFRGQNADLDREACAAELTGSILRQAGVEQGSDEYINTLNDILNDSYRAAGGKGDRPQAGMVGY